MNHTDLDIIKTSAPEGRYSSKKEQDVAELYNAIQQSYFAALSILDKVGFGCGDKKEHERRWTLLTGCYEFMASEIENLDDRYGIDTGMEEIWMPLKASLMKDKRPVSTNPASNRHLIGAAS